MKTLKNTAALMAAVIALACWYGCTTPGDTAYKTIATTEATVDAAMKTWADYVAWQKCYSYPAGMDATTFADRQAQVKKAYTTYRTAMNAAYDARAAYLADKQAGGTQWTSAISAAQAAATTLEQLVNIWNVKK